MMTHMVNRILSCLYSAMLALIFGLVFALVCTSCTQQAPKPKPASLGKGGVYMSHEDRDPYVPAHKIDRVVSLVPRKAETPSVTVTASRGPSLALIDSYREQLAELLNAIGVVESLNCDDAVGDNGFAKGRFQIWEVYWKDAVQYAPAIGGRYLDVFDRTYAERIVVAYWMRYAEGAIESGKWDILARIHNGGPRGYLKNATIPYWNRVIEVLEN